MTCEAGPTSNIAAPPVASITPKLAFVRRPSASVFSSNLRKSSTEAHVCNASFIKPPFPIPVLDELSFSPLSSLRSLLSEFSMQNPVSFTPIQTDFRLPALTTANMRYLPSSKSTSSLCRKDVSLFFQRMGLPSCVTFPLITAVVQPRLARVTRTPKSKITATAVRRKEWIRIMDLSLFFKTTRKICTQTTTPLPVIVWSGATSRAPR